jgi:neutral ceramidase
VAFPQSASGDISPNVRGARCVNDRSQPCDEVTGEASGEDGNGRVTRCAGLGPAGDDDVAGCVATGAAQAAVALEALVAPDDASPSGVVNIAGAVRHAHGWLPVGRGVAVDGRFTIDGKPGRTSSPAKGYSFAAGTTDGPGQDGFLQGVKLAGESAEGAEEGADTAVVDETRRYETQVKRWGFASAVASWALSGFKRWGVPTRVKEAHAPKPVLLHFGDVNTSEVDTREDQSWVAVDVPVQMLRIGRLLVACVPAEVTTTAGARLTRWIKETARSAASSDGDDDWEVIVTGLANGYAGYVTTPEEYAAQRYEGASTLYGQNTLGRVRAVSLRVDERCNYSFRRWFGTGTGDRGLDHGHGCGRHPRNNGEERVTGRSPAARSPMAAVEELRRRARVQRGCPGKRFG